MFFRISERRINIFLPAHGGAFGSDTESNSEDAER